MKLAKHFCCIKSTKSLVYQETDISFVKCVIDFGKMFGLLRRNISDLRVIANQVNRVNAQRGYMTGFGGRSEQNKAPQVRTKFKPMSSVESMFQTNAAAFHSGCIFWHECLEIF